MMGPRCSWPSQQARLETSSGGCISSCSSSSVKSNSQSRYKDCGTIRRRRRHDGPSSTHTRVSTGSCLCILFLLAWTCPLAVAADNRAARAGGQSNQGPPSRTAAQPRLNATYSSSQPRGRHQQRLQMAAPASNPAAFDLLVSHMTGQDRRRPQLPGIEYEYLLSRHQREKGISYMGTGERLRRAMARVLAGQRLVVGVVGGSISSGHGAEDAPNWVDRVEKFLQDAYGKNSTLKGDILLNNGAVPGTTSSYAAACMRLHVPEDANIVLVEYAVNDLREAYPAFDNPERRAFERLIRKLLLLPQRPAVVLVNAYSYFVVDPHEGAYWNNVEAEYNVIAQYYNLVSLSVRGCCYQAMLANITGFQVHAVREPDMERLKGKVFYFDSVHPDGQTGHRAMAELVIHLLQRTTHSLLHNPLQFLDHAAAAAHIPRPMVPHNHASLENQCFIGPEFKAKSVVDAKGWEWVNESKTARPKWGYVSKQPGSKLAFKVNATASSGNTTAPVLVQIGYLSSYQHMGKGLLQCDRGCKCKPSMINGHWNRSASLTSLHAVTVTPSPKCVMSVTVTPQTDSGEHKVKIMAVMVSEEGGDAVGIDNAGAVEHVHDISFRHAGFGDSKLFDVRNHAH